MLRQPSHAERDRISSGGVGSSRRGFSAAQSALSKAVFGPLRKSKKAGIRASTQKELKYKDRDHAASTVLTTGSSGSLINDIATGSGANQRVGRNIWIKSIYVVGRFNMATTTLVADAYNLVFFAIILDRRHNKAASTPLFTDVFTTADETPLLRMDQGGRFKVLKRATFNMGSSVVDSSTSSYLGHYVPFTWYLNFKKGIKMSFSGATGATVEREHNNIYLLSMCSGADVTQTYLSRCRFYD